MAAGLPQPRGCGTDIDGGGGTAMLRWLRPIALLVVASALLRPSPGEAQAAALLVDDDRAQCPAATFTAIQAAIDAAGPRGHHELSRGPIKGAPNIGPRRDPIQPPPPTPPATAIATHPAPPNF